MMGSLSRRAVMMGTAAVAASLGLPAALQAAAPLSTAPEWPRDLPRHVLRSPEVVAAGRAVIENGLQCAAAGARRSGCRVVAGWVLTEADLYAIGMATRPFR